MIFEHAFCLHRLGENQAAFEKLKQLAGDQEETSSLRYQHLLS